MGIGIKSACTLSLSLSACPSVCFCICLCLSVCPSLYLLGEPLHQHPRPPQPKEQRLQSTRFNVSSHSFLLEFVASPLPRLPRRFYAIPCSILSFTLLPTSSLASLSSLPAAPPCPAAIISAVTPCRCCRSTIAPASRSILTIVVDPWAQAVIEPVLPRARSRAHTHCHT